MEGWEVKALSDELAQGMEKAMQLRLHLSPTQAQDLLLLRIISTFDRALCFLRPSISSDDISQNDHHHGHGHASNKRKLQPSWTEQVKVNSENAVEGPRDDGYSWRKYGQKDILGAKYPRSYYRCTYRHGRNCWATKQVQRSDDDPTVFEITYKGTHTCKKLENQQLKRSRSSYDQLEHNPILSNFKSHLRVSTEVSDIQEMPAHLSFPATFACHENENHRSPVSALAEDNHLGAYSPLFDSPATSGSNNFSTGMYRMRDYQHSETDIMSADASTTNSPSGGIEFLVPVELDPDFPFNIPGFELKILS